MKSEVIVTLSTCRWVLRYSSAAFALLVLIQSYGVLMVTPQFRSLFVGFGASIPPMALFALQSYWTGSAVSAAISLASTIYIWMYPRAPLGRMKVAYGLALTSLVAAFAWSGFVAAALYQQIFKLGTPI